MLRQTGETYPKAENPVGDVLTSLPSVRWKMLPRFLELLAESVDLQAPSSRQLPSLIVEIHLGDPASRLRAGKCSTRCKAASRALPAPAVVTICPASTNPNVRGYLGLWRHRAEPVHLGVERCHLEPVEEPGGRQRKRPLAHREQHGPLATPCFSQATVSGLLLTSSPTPPPTMMTSGSGAEGANVGGTYADRREVSRRRSS